ncbi:MAG: hypothetical protein Kow0080_25890 [Candidatus Promineifilaceae bacterium]
MQSNDPTGLKLQRERDLSEQLLGDSRLRNNLTDAQASQLFDWALAQIRKLTERTAFLPEEDASPVIDQQFAAIRTIVKLVNEIMGSLEQTQDELDIVPGHVYDEMTLRLFKTLRWFEGARIAANRVETMRTFNAQRPYTTPDYAFQQIMAVVTGQTTP